MTHPDIFTLQPNEHEARTAAEALFQRVRAQLAAHVPAGTEILHIGATAIPGCLTKGDLDIAVRVDDKNFADVEAMLAGRYLQNSGSIRTDDFSAFEDDSTIPHLGIQLVKKGGEYDFFHTFTAALRADPKLVRRYNALKAAHDGKPMDAYRAAKAAFVRKVLEVHGRNEDETRAGRVDPRADFAP